LQYATRVRFEIARFESRKVKAGAESANEADRKCLYIIINEFSMCTYNNVIEHLESGLLHIKVLFVPWQAHTQKEQTLIYIEMAR
jgi:hypothetical protein